MNHQEFMKLAERLAVEHGPAEWRSAVSRAYYAAFHAGRSLVQACGIRIPETAEAHTKVVWCLQHSNVQVVVTAAASMTYLRSKRNLADYDLQSTEFNSSSKILVLVNSCKQASQVFEAADSASVRIGMREYARDVLKLQLLA
jgi:uncharacterized protein (UPF0332 family)